MQVRTVMAQLIVTDIDAAVDFYRALFGRDPDAAPMLGLKEWHFDDAGAVQVYAEPERAGCSGATIHLDDLDDAVAALDRAGLAHEPITDATYVRIVMLADPDGNRLVLSGDRTT
jgi:predicted enzyme related to lactoylglutathione lyase